MTSNYHALAAGISEAAFQRRVTDLCAFLGLLVHHETDSRRTRAGFPDLFIVGAESQGLMLVELKTEKGRLSPEQQTWLARTTSCSPTQHNDIRAEVWRPRDWESQHIQRTLHRLAGRRYYDPDPARRTGGE